MCRCIKRIKELAVYMKRKLEISELIFKIISYTLLTIFALCCLYPFLYAISASISGRHAVEYNELILFPKDLKKIHWFWQKVMIFEKLTDLEKAH